LGEPPIVPGQGLSRHRARHRSTGEGGLLAAGGKMSKRFEHGLRVAAMLVLIGLFVELVSLSWHHPLAFVLFVTVGGLAIAGGVLFFFYNIVTVPEEGA